MRREIVQDFLAFERLRARVLEEGHERTAISALHSGSGLFPHLLLLAARGASVH